MQHSLEEVERQFLQWRQSKKNARERIPSSLLQAAAALTTRHKKGEITRRLRLDARALRPYLPASPPSKKVSLPPTFVEVAPSVTRLSSSVPVLSCRQFEVERRDGSRMRFHACDKQGFDASVLMNAFLEGSDVTSYCSK